MYIHTPVHAYIRLYMHVVVLTTLDSIGNSCIWWGRAVNYCEMGLRNKRKNPEKLGAKEKVHLSPVDAGGETVALAKQRFLSAVHSNVIIKVRYIVALDAPPGNPFTTHPGGI